MAGCGLQVFNYSTIFLTSNGVDAATVVIISVLMNVGNVAITVVSVRLMDLSGRRAWRAPRCHARCGGASST